MQIMRFKTLDEVVERANNSEYGLAAGILSNDFDRINYISHSLRAGSIWSVSDYIINIYSKACMIYQAPKMLTLYSKLLRNSSDCDISIKRVRHKFDNNYFCH